VKDAVQAPLLGHCWLAHGLQCYNATVDVVLYEISTQPSLFLRGLPCAAEPAYQAFCAVHIGGYTVDGQERPDRHKHTYVASIVINRQPQVRIMTRKKAHCGPVMLLLIHLGRNPVICAVGLAALRPLDLDWT
jgi:hypothetical protein